VWSEGRRAGVRAIGGEVKRDDPDDPFVRQVMGAAAQLERGLVTARMQAGKRRARAEGRSNGGHRPYGFELEGAVLVEVQHEQQILERIRRWRAGGQTLQEIADTLSAADVPAAGGGRWHRMAVKRVTDREP
jgi:DNA invertase Pin-like site-specific DNA recombinase